MALWSRSLGISFPYRNNTCLCSSSFANRVSEDEKNRNLFHAIKLAAVLQWVMNWETLPCYAINRARRRQRRHHKAFGDTTIFRPILESYAPDHVFLSETKRIHGLFVGGRSKTKIDKTCQKDAKNERRELSRFC